MIKGGDMYHILPKSKDNVIGIRVEGKMRTKDYETLLPFIESMIKKYRTIRILADLSDLKGVELRGILKVLPYTFKFSSKIEKKALVTNGKWLYTWAKLLAPFFKTEVRCFPNTKVEQAWKWINK